MKLHNLNIFEADRLNVLTKKGIKRMSDYEIREYQLLCEKAIGSFNFKRRA